MTAVPTPAKRAATTPDATPAPAFAVAVVELLGSDEARRRASDLAAEAQIAAIPVRIVARRHPAESVPQRRRRAVEATAEETGAPAVLLVEDTTRLAPGWAEALRTAFADARVAAVCGRVQVAADLPPRYRALGRLEYGRFDGTRPGVPLPGNALALRRADLRQVLAPGEGIVEHDLERRLAARGLEIRGTAALTAIYARPDRHGVRLSTRFGHGRLYGAGCDGNRALGMLRALLAMPVLSLRGFRAARAAGPARQWLPELPWIATMSAAWALGELTGRIAGRGTSEGSWT